MANGKADVWWVICEIGSRRVQRMDKEKQTSDEVLAEWNTEGEPPEYYQTAKPLQWEGRRDDNGDMPVR